LLAAPGLGSRSPPGSLAIECAEGVRLYTLRLIHLPACDRPVSLPVGVAPELLVLGRRSSLTFIAAIMLGQAAAIMHMCGTRGYGPCLRRWWGEGAPHRHAEPDRPRDRVATAL
jgi:hypothetical protein